MIAIAAARRAAPPGDDIMPTRRAVLAAGGLGLAAIGGRAWSTPFPAPLQAAMTTLRKEGRYLPLWRLAKSDEHPELKDFLKQNAAYVGDELTALARERVGGPSAPDLAGAIAEPALPAIVKASAGRRVVMLNEAHTASRHRLFLAQLLRALRAEGFTHLAAETFANGLGDAAKVEGLRAGDRVSFDHGTYIADPVFAEAVREGLDLGYRLVAHEQRPDQASATSDMKASIAAREQAQAKNLHAALLRWPEGRFVVFVGYSHLDERAGAHMGPWFAARLKMLTGLDPLTVGQAQSGSFGPHGPDDPLTTAVLRRFEIARPSLIRKDGAPVAAVEWPGDLTVYHPSLPEVRGRPGWLAADPTRRWAMACFRPSKAVRLLQAIRAADPDPAIPADQLIVEPGAKGRALLLRPGRYRLRLEVDEGFEPLGELAVA